VRLSLLWRALKEADACRSEKRLFHRHRDTADCHFGGMAVDLKNQQDCLFGSLRPGVDVFSSKKPVSDSISQIWNEIS
jgi:hypothetical protein